MDTDDNRTHTQVTPTFNTPRTGWMVEEISPSVWGLLDPAGDGSVVCVAATAYRNEQIASPPRFVQYKYVSGLGHVHIRINHDHWFENRWNLKPQWLELLFSSLVEKGNAAGELEMTGLTREQITLGEILQRWREEIQWLKGLSRSCRVELTSRREEDNTPLQLSVILQHEQQETRWLQGLCSSFKRD